MKKNIAIIIFCAFSLLKTYAQDVQLTQFYEADVLLNPALVGKAHHPRIMGHQRLQWPGASAKYLTSMISLDSYSSKYQSGFGGYFLHDYQGNGQVSSKEISLLYSYDLHINDMWSFKAGAQWSGVQKKIDYIGLYYPDQVTSDGYVSESSENNNISSRFYGDLSTGGLLYTEKFWLGASWHHITEPNQSLLGAEDNLPSKFTLITGYKIKLDHPSAQTYSGYLKEFYIFPMLHYKAQGTSDQLDFGIFGIDDQLKFGVWYRGIPTKKYRDDLQNNESVSIQVGWLLRHIQFSYSYDFIVSKLLPAQPRGAHELNITYIIFRDGVHHPQKKLPCPDFQRPPSRTPNKLY